MEASFDDLQRIKRDDPAYLRDAAAEADFWQQIRPDSLEALEGRIVEGVSERYTNRRFTGRPEMHWEETVCRWGTFRCGLALGTASLSLEARLLATNPDLHLTFIDISDGPLERRRDALGQRFPGRVATLMQDLNFAEFEPDTYDVVVSSSTIHHVTNLEYLAATVNRALTPEGYFFLQDYVGEPRFQLEQRKKDMYQAVFARLATREARSSALHWSGSDDLSPFCGVRSNEILPVFSQHLELIETRTAGALLIAMMRSQPVAAPTRRAGTIAWVARRAHRRLARLVGRRYNTDIDPTFFDEVTLVSDLLSDGGVINPGNAFAVFRKRAQPDS